MPRILPAIGRLSALVLLLLCAVTAIAESCYVLPTGWHYNSEGQIVAPEEWYSNTTGEIVGYPERTYSSIWEDECIRRLKSYDRGYGNVEYMDEHLRIYGNTQTAGAGKVSTILLTSSSAVIISAIVARKIASR